MPSPSTSPGLRVAIRCVVALSCSLVALAQDPAAEQPPHRTVGIASETVSAFTAHGLSRLDAGWHWEARRAFREIAKREPDSPIGWLGMAVSSREYPRLAAGLAWKAYQRRAGASGNERRLVEAYARYFDANDRPSGAEEHFDHPPAPPRHVALCAELDSMARDSAGGLAARLRAVERGAIHDADRVLTAAAARQRVLAHNRFLAERRVMPFIVPNYRGDLARALGEDGARHRLLARLPRHPRFGVEAPAVPPELVIDPSETDRAFGWAPRLAPTFDLVRGLGGRRASSHYDGKPLLVVFFLGFGCVHCVAQLGELDPVAPRFRAAGIEVVTIGTDTAQQVKAAHQMALENGVDPLHMDVLCDPNGESFRRYGAWDEFEQEALHGTFLVDARGRILWQDISAQPFMETEFLLAECQRLLAAWQ